MLPSVRAIGTPKRMLLDAMRRSQTPATPAPPPVQAPLMAAMVGLGQSSIAESTPPMRSS